MAKVMDSAELADFWFEADPDVLVCCVCEKKIGSTALIRTFRFYDSSCGIELLKHTKIISRHTSENIVIHDRHLQCLLQSGIKYSAISHVWDPAISYAQSLGRFAPRLREASTLVIQQLLLIYRGLLKSDDISELDEIWHDYISVPQWSDEIKDRILLAIPDIYGSAYMTAIHFEDLIKESVRKLYQSKSTNERLKSITDICNSNWFTRVWTAMEYVRSRRVIAMDQEFDICSDSTDPLLLNRMFDVWYDELLKHDSVHHLEDRAGIGKNLVPWNLGPLMVMGKEKSSVFGQAYSLLSKRRCQNNHDFLHALLGLVKPVSDRPLERHFDHEFERIAKLCLAVGDYSPLLMTPPLKNYDQRMDDIQGFNDVGTWPLGSETKPPEFHGDFSFEHGEFEEANPVLNLQRLGSISHFYVRPLACDLMAEFAREASIVLRATGPDIDSFISTLGQRLYCQKAEYINQKLVANNEWDKLTSVLRKRHHPDTQNTWPIEGPDGARWLAEAMTLSLITPDVFVGEPVSRMAWVNLHGGTIHVGYAGLSCILSVLCSSCQRICVFRTGFFELPNNFEDYVVYRIPGLEFQHSYPNGMGIVLKGGLVVGRMAWATPACECSIFEKVRIKMPVFARPTPRPYK